MYIYNIKSRIIVYYAVESDTVVNFRTTSTRRLQLPVLQCKYIPVQQWFICAPIENTTRQKGRTKRKKTKSNHKMYKYKVHY
jgi:hypothetical protein